MTVGYIIALGGKSTDYETGGYLLFGGGIAFNVGIPLWISGSVKASNNRRAMEIITSDKSLSLTSTNNGIGLVFKF